MKTFNTPTIEQVADSIEKFNQLIRFINFETSLAPYSVSTNMGISGRLSHEDLVIAQLDINSPELFDGTVSKTLTLAVAATSVLNNGRQAANPSKLRELMTSVVGVHSLPDVITFLLGTHGHHPTHDDLDVTVFRLMSILNLTEIEFGAMCNILLFDVEYLTKNTHYEVSEETRVIEKEYAKRHIQFLESELRIAKLRLNTLG